MDVFSILPEKRYTMKPPAFLTRKKVVIPAVAIVVVLAGFLTWLLHEPNDGLVSVLATVRISRVVIEPLSAVKVDRTTEVNDEVLSAHVTGSCHTTGTVSIELTPDQTKAAFNLILAGESISNTVGVSGPARITSRASTKYTAVKEVMFDGDSFETTPAEVTANTDLKIEDVDSTEPGIRGRIVKRVAERRVREEFEESRRLAAQRVIDQVSKGFDEAVQKHLDRLNEQLKLDRLLSGQVENHARLPLRFKTTKDSLHVTFLAEEGEPRQLPAFTLTPSSAVRVGLNLVALAKNPIKTIKAVRLLYESNKSQKASKDKPEGKTLLAADGDSIRAVNVGTEGGWIVIHIDEDGDGKPD